MKNQKHKTTAMLADALKAHHRTLFWIDMKYWMGIALIVGITGAVVIYG